MTLKPGRMYVHSAGVSRCPWTTLRLEHASSRHSVAPSDDGSRACHAHDVYHLVVVVAGSGSFLLTEGPVAVRAPCLVLVSPGRPHTFQRAPGDDTVYSEATFSGTSRMGGPLRQSWSALLSERYGQSCALPMHGPISPNFANELDALFADLVGVGLAEHPSAEGFAVGLLDQILFTLFRRLVADGDQDHDALERARLLIQARHDQPLDLDGLSARVGLSPKHLGRAFKRRYGIPPNQYRRRVAIDHAATLLRSTQLPLAAIAERLGFADVPYFNRVFTAIRGEPPGRYRRRSMKAEGDL